MIEHAAVPHAAYREQRGGDQTGARTGDEPRGGRCSRDAADAGGQTHDVANEVGVRRQHLGQQRGENIEQPPIEIKISEPEQ